MDDREIAYTAALLGSLRESPLLVGDLPEARVWKGPLGMPGGDAALNFDQKLGHLYEDALEVLIRASSVWELLAKNLQVSDETGRTIGEMDFLIRVCLQINSKLAGTPFFREQGGCMAAGASSCPIQLTQFS